MRVGQRVVGNTPTEPSHGEKPGGVGKGRSLRLARWRPRAPERPNELPGKHSHYKVDSAGMPKR